MILRSHQAEDSLLAPTDVCIVGSGPAGIVLALELARAGKRVVVLESGGIGFDEGGAQALAGGTNDAGVSAFDLETTRLRMLGGTSNHWGGTCHPLHAVDFEARRFHGTTGWPLAHRDLVRHYRSAHEWCELGPWPAWGSGDYSEDLDVWVQRLGHRRIEWAPMSVRPTLARLSPPTQFGLRYREELETTAGLTVILEATVTRVAADPSAGAVTHLDVARPDGSTFAVQARAYVFAAGGIENARLLLASNDRVAEGVGNGRGLVGRYYADHPSVALNVMLSDRAEFEAARFIFDGKQYLTDGLGGARGLLTPRPETLREHDIGNFAVWLDNGEFVSPGLASLWSAWELGPLHGGVLEAARHFANGIVDMDRIAAALLERTGRRVLPPATRSRIAREPAAIWRSRMQVIVEQRPNPESRVTLSDRRDRFGNPLAHLAWKLAPEDRRTMRVAADLAAAACIRWGIGRSRRTLDPLGEAPLVFSISCHHSGTTRMAESPRHGVVDPDCRVHDWKNLFVAGSSIFPTFGWANPTLTIVALASRLAEFLTRDLP